MIKSDKISTPYDLTHRAIIKLKNIIAKEKAKSVETQEKSISDDEKHRETQLKEIERLKAQGKFNPNSTKSQREKEREP